MQRDTAAKAKRLVILRDLIVLRHVRVVIVLTVELADFRYVAAEHQAGPGREAKRLSVHHRQCAGKTEAGRASMGIRFGPVLDPATAEHFALGLQLGVNLKADRCNVFSAHFAKLLKSVVGAVRRRF